MLIISVCDKTKIAKNGYTNFALIPDQINIENKNMWIGAVKSFNEKAIKTISDQLNSLPGAVEIIVTC